MGKKRRDLLIFCSICIFFAFCLGALSIKKPKAAVIPENNKVNKSEQFKINNISIDGYLGEKIMALDFINNNIELEISGVKKLSKGCKVYIKKGDKLEEQPLKTLHIGMDGAEFSYNDKGEMEKIILHRGASYENVRVALRKDVNEPSKPQLLYYDNVLLKMNEDTKLEDKKENKVFSLKKEQQLKVLCDKGKIKVMDKDNNKIYETSNRLYFTPSKKEGEIQILSLTRGPSKSSFNPSYKGTIEINLKDKDCFTMINELSIEDYLCRVVPSEIPYTFGLEACKTQAVVSRTLVVHDYENNRFSKDGYWVDDSTLCQVYNNIRENEVTNKAVMETKGIVAKDKDNNLILAEFYDASGGFGAGIQEAWFNKDKPIEEQGVEYLKAKSYTYDPKNEDKMLSLSSLNESLINKIYKDLSYKAYDSDSPFFRWKVNFSKAELENTINKNIQLMYERDRGYILTKNKNGSFESKPIPKGGVGSIRNLVVARRGESGNVMELIVEGSNGTFKIMKEFNVRFTIRPRKEDTQGKDVSLYLARSGSNDYDKNLTRLNYSILPSAFFTFDIGRDKKGNLETVTFYGGGNGHGVGIPQEGMRALGQKGMSYEKIIQTYLDNVKVCSMDETTKS